MIISLFIRLSIFFSPSNEIYERISISVNECKLLQLIRVTHSIVMEHIILHQLCYCFFVLFYINNYCVNYFFCLN